jgi:DNA invertase Pin-like site-specific DNA recombinase
MKVAGYVRVSTREQGDSGLGLQAQKQKLATETSRRGWQLADVYTEVASGKTMRRAVLEGLLEDLDAGNFDALMFTRLDRITRSVGDFAALMARAEEHEWALVMLEPDIDMTTPFGRAMAHVASAFAQLERELIGQRTREGLEVARERGTFRPGEHSRYVDRGVIARIADWRAQGGHSYGRIADRLNAEGVPAPNGGAWHARTVNRIATREGIG